MNDQDYPTAKNPTTGERFVYKDGRWQPIAAAPVTPPAQQQATPTSPIPPVQPQGQSIPSQSAEEGAQTNQAMPKSPSMADMAVQSRMMGLSGIGLKEAPETFGDYLRPLTTEDWWKTTGSNFLKEGWEFIKSQPEFAHSISPTGWAGNLAKRMAFATKPTTKEEAIAPLKEAAAPFTSVTGMVKELVGTAKDIIEDPIKAINEKPFKVALLATTIFGPKATAKMRMKLRAKAGLTAADLEEAFIASGGKMSELATAPSPVQKIITAIKSAKPARAEQEVGFTIERGKRFAKAKEVGKQIPGEKGFYAEKAQLAGELPKIKWESIRQQFTQGEMEELFQMINEHPRLIYTDTLTARTGLVKLLGEKGFSVPTEGELLMLNKVYGPEFAKSILSKRAVWQKIKGGIFEAANIPRAIMASFDLSAPLRQGVFMIGHKEFYKSFGSMFKYFSSEKAFQALFDDIAKRTNYPLMRKSKLALTELDVPLAFREEAIMAHLPEKIPIIGKGIRASNRAYTGFLNKLRADVFDDLIKKADNLGLDPRKNATLSENIANFVNAGTGRGTLWNLEKHVVGLNSFFFSPRLMASRFNLLNPAYYIKLDPFVRKEALKSLFAFTGAGLTTLGLAKLGGAEVGLNPLSSDFGKIKLGNTRLDIWGGFQQYIRTTAQFVAGKTVSPISGKTAKLGEGYRPDTRFDVATRFLEYKTAPLVSFALALAKGQGSMGGELNVPKEVANRFTPMAIQDIIDIAKDNPDLIPVSVLGLFGVGLQTYKSRSKGLRR